MCEHCGSGTSLQTQIDLLKRFQSELKTQLENGSDPELEDRVRQTQDLLDHLTAQDAAGAGLK
jgi:hypothetical protein